MNSAAFIAWPPPFRVRKSKRARQVRLTLGKQRGLELVVPWHFKPQLALNVLEAHRAWIEKNWQRIQPMLSPAAIELPQAIHLLAANEKWTVCYQLVEGSPLSLKEQEGCSLVIAGVADAAKISQLLLQWLRHRAKAVLLPRLAMLSQQVGLSYLSATIRSASTRWGSCSAKKTISLNSKLLFLPLVWVDYVLYHELCHTIHLNHSRQFWELLQSINPNCHESRKNLKTANVYLPAWAEAQ
jgi:hypothetical protein